MPEYIEREKFRNILEAKAEMAIGTPKEVFYNAVKMLELIPTADVVEVRHGEWIEFEDNFFDTLYQCSVCKEEFVLAEGTPSENLWNYCPNCGAKMDGKGD